MRDDSCGTRVTLTDGVGEDDEVDVREWSGAVSGRTAELNRHSSDEDDAADRLADVGRFELCCDRHSPCCDYCLDVSHTAARSGYAWRCRGEVQVQQLLVCGCAVM
jgi:hypothetical protein